MTESREVNNNDESSDDDIDIFVRDPNPYMVTLTGLITDVIKLIRLIPRDNLYRLYMKKKALILYI